jgi:hypothetical protein
LTLSAELSSITDRTLSVLYPISIAGSGVGKAVSVTYAELAADHANDDLGPPTPLSRIRGRAHVEVWIRMRIACRVPRFVLRGARLSIALAGTSAPAVFSFRDLFGSSPPRRPDPC